VLSVGAFRVPDSGFKFLGSGFIVQVFTVQGSRFRVQGSGFRVQGITFRVQDSGFKASRLRVES